MKQYLPVMHSYVLLYIKKMMVQRLILLLTNGFQPAAWKPSTERKNSGFAVEVVGWHNSAITSCEFGQIVWSMLQFPHLYMN